jgi:hypothetical protein
MDEDMKVFSSALMDSIGIINIDLSRMKLQGTLDFRDVFVVGTKPYVIGHFSVCLQKETSLSPIHPFHALIDVKDWCKKCLIAGLTV